MTDALKNTSAIPLRPRRWIIATLATLALLAFLLARIPARWVLAQAAPTLNLHAATASGTLWHGSATELQVAGVTLPRLDWNLSTWRLLTGRLAGQFDARLPDGFLRGNASISLGDSIVFSNLEAAIPASRITDRIPAAQGLVSGGSISLQLKRLVITGEGIQAAEGKASLSDLRVAYGYDDTLGTYAGEIQTGPNGKISGSAHDVSGPVMLQATLSLEQGSNYQVRGSLTARDENGQIAQALNMLGRADARGAHPFQYSGRLPLPRF